MKERCIFCCCTACCIVGLVCAVLIAGYRSEEVAEVDLQDEQQVEEVAPEQPPEEIPELKDIQEESRTTLRKKTLEMEGTMPKRVVPPDSDAPSSEGTSNEPKTQY